MKIQLSTFVKNNFSGGFSLITCLVLTIVLNLITMATLGFTYDFQLFADGRIDRLIAKGAADVALQDAYTHLKISDEDRKSTRLNSSH